MRVNPVLSVVIIFLAAATWPHSAFLPRPPDWSQNLSLAELFSCPPQHTVPGTLLHLPPPQVRLVHPQILLGDLSCTESPYHCLSS